MREVVRLVPVPLDEGPVSCKITAVTPGSPAQAAGLEVGDEIREIGGRRYAQAAEFLKALNDAPDSLDLTIGRKGREKKLRIPLAPQSPRLGVRCDIRGVQALVADASAKDLYIVVENQRGVTFMADAESEGKLVLVRLRIQNFTDAAVEVDPRKIMARDGTGTTLSAVSSAEARRYLGSRPQAVVKAAETGALIRQTLPPESVAPGSVYFAGPAAYPFILSADVDGRHFEFHFENRKTM